MAIAQQFVELNELAAIAENSARLLEENQIKSHAVKCRNALSAMCKLAVAIRADVLNFKKALPVRKLVIVDPEPQPEPEPDAEPEGEVEPEDVNVEDIEIDEPPPSPPKLVRSTAKPVEKKPKTVTIKPPGRKPNTKIVRAYPQKTKQPVNAK